MTVLKKALIFISLIISSGTFGFKFSPLSQELSPEGKGRRGNFYVENESQEALALSIKVTGREMDMEGRENRPPAGADIFVFPKQLILPPNSKRAIQVQWRGNERVLNEKSYRLIVEQLPINLSQKEEKKTRIRVLLKYVASLYVTPPKGKSKIRFKAYPCKPEGTMALLAFNEGQKHQLLNNLELNIRSKSLKDPILFEPQELLGLNGENVLAKGKRKVHLKCPKELKGVEEQLIVSFKFDP
jgi:fimbrial chaperone protein